MQHNITHTKVINAGTRYNPTSTCKDENKTEGKSEQSIERGMKRRK
jgi:hypothetical protein